MCVSVGGVEPGGGGCGASHAGVRDPGRRPRHYSPPGGSEGHQCAARPATVRRCRIACITISLLFSGVPGIGAATLYQLCICVKYCKALINFLDLFILML